MERFISELERWQNDIKELADVLKKEMDSFPKGSLRYNTNKDYTNFFHQSYEKGLDNGKKYKREYLRKGDPMINLLARKRVIKAYYPILIHNLKLLDYCVAHWNDKTLDDLIGELPGPVVRHFKKISPFPEIGGNAVDWESAEPNPNYPENLIHSTINGEKVRSKSEALIANLLYTYKVPYKYEAPLRLGEQEYWPDFTIVRPGDKKIFYWEHFGLTGDEAYKAKMEKKLETYKMHGILLWTNLITSYDDAFGAIDTRMIEKIIRCFLIS